MPDKNEFETDKSNLTQDQMLLGFINHSVDDYVNKNLDYIMQLAELHKLRRQDFEDDMFYKEPAKFDSFLAEVVNTYFAHEFFGLAEYNFTDNSVRFQANRTIIESIIKRKKQF